jgi:hypothetical protein
MRKASPFLLPLALATCLFNFAGGHAARAQSPNGAIDLTATAAPTSARPEPVRQFTFYVLTKSYADIEKDVEEQEAAPDRDKFIEDLKVSPELKEWLGKHDTFDLTSPNLDTMVSPDDIIKVPEFLLAYQRSNAGGVTSGLPKPRFVEADKAANPDRYQKQHDDYLAALKKFIQSHPESVSGFELQLAGVNPEYRWAQKQATHQKRVQQLAPQMAQTKYLAARADTDLEGHASVSGLPSGSYWISTLNIYVGAGDTRLCWDVPVSIEAGRTTRVDLSNLHATPPPRAMP